MAGALSEHTLPPLRRCAALGLLIAALGCQQSPTTVVGEVTLDGKPLATAANSRGTVVFQPVGAQGATPTGLLDTKGYFKLAAGASNEIAPGKYRVAVSVVELVPASEGAERGGKRTTPAKYASAGTSDLEAEVVEGPNDFQFALVSAADDVPQPTDSTVVAPIEHEPAQTPAEK